AAGNDDDGGGTGGDIQIASTNGAVSITAPMTLEGAPPDGSGGGLDVSAPGDVTISAGPFASSDGLDSSRGGHHLHPGRETALRPVIRANGGSSGGGSVFATAAGNVTAPQEIGADGTELGGTISLEGADVQVSGKVHANGTDADADGGLVTFTACNLTVAGT